MSPTNKSNLDGTISKLRADVKQHAINIQEKVQQVNPIKPMTEFEKRSLELQEQTSRIQKLALEEQQRSAQEQLSFQKKVESKKKAEEIMTSFEKVKERCSHFATEVKPSA